MLQGALNHREAWAQQTVSGRLPVRYLRSHNWRCSSGTRGYISFKLVIKISVNWRIWHCKLTHTVFIQEQFSLSLLKYLCHLYLLGLQWLLWTFLCDTFLLQLRYMHCTGITYRTAVFGLGANQWRSSRGLYPAHCKMSPCFFYAFFRVTHSFLLVRKTIGSSDWEIRIGISGC